MLISPTAAVQATFKEAGQGQTLAFVDSLSLDDQTALLTDLAAIDPGFCNKIFKAATESTAATDAAKLEGLPASVVDSVIGKGKDAKVQEWTRAGMKLIEQGKVGVLLMAGGQGTRLGSSAPKGCYDIGLPSHKSLFQLQAERILRLQNLASEALGGKPVVIPWYIMKLGSATPDYFKEKGYFGLEAKNIVFFEQGTLPTFDMSGKILLETKSKVSVAPDGNGGIYRALRVNGILKDMEARGVTYLHAYCVDNCLVKVANPTFIGYCVSKNAQCGAMVVPKVEPTESVGVLCLRNGKPSVVEYSEIQPATASARAPDGSLQLKAANIANHFYTLDFLKQAASKDWEARLEYHVAKKKIKHVDPVSGTAISPAAPNGIKLELFVFDVFPFVPVAAFAVLEVPRDQEFSPLKNAPGAPTDSPETSRADILAQHARFLEAAGATVVRGPTDGATGPPAVELSPLVSYNGEGLEAVKGATLTSPLCIATLDDLKKAAKKT